MMDFSSKTNDEIDTWIENHEEKKATDLPLYKELLEERARRQSNQLNIDVSLRHLIQAAHAKNFTTYGELAEANSVPWSVARHTMNGPRGHLDRLLDVCHARGYPLLTSICVNQGGRDSGELGAETMKGFVAGVRRLGYILSDESVFLRECQNKCFEWAKEES